MLFLRSSGESGAVFPLLAFEMKLAEEPYRPRRCLPVTLESSLVVRLAGVTRIGGGVMVAGSGSTCAALRLSGSGVT
jgi:hypothetical protein